MTVKVAIGVLCTLVNQKYQNEVKACQETWCQLAKKHGIPVYFFAGYLKMPEFSEIIHFDEVKEDYASVFHKQYYGLQWLYKNVSADYYYIVSSDTFVHVENLLKIFDRLDEYKDQDLYIGGHGDIRNINGKSIYFHSGGSGFILTSSATRKIVEITDKILSEWKTICEKSNSPTLIPASDVAVAYYSSQLGFKTVKVPGFHGCSYKGLVGSFRCCKDVNIDTLNACHYMDPNSMFDYYKYITKDSELSQNVVHEDEHVTTNENDSTSNWTLVSFFIDLSKRPDASSKSHSLESYLERSRYVLSLPCNLVLFCNPEFVPHFTKLRQEFKLEHKFKCIPTEFEDLQLAPFWDQIVQNRKQNPYHFDPRNTPSYFILTTSKFLLVKKAIDLNPFSSTHFGWIDIGLSQISLKDPKEVLNVLGEQRDKFSLCYINYTAEHVMNSLPVYYQYGRCGTACGFFTGRHDYMKTICDLVHEKFVQTVKAGYGHAEEQLVPPIYHKHPELFQIYFGDYHQLIKNYVHVTEKPETTLNLLIPNCRCAGNFQLGREACQSLLDSYDLKCCTFTKDMYIKLLDEFYMISHHQNDHSTCYDVFKRMGHFARD